VLTKNEVSEVSEYSRELIHFHSQLTTFLSRLNDRRPANHPDPPLISPASILSADLAKFFTDQSNVQTVQMGYEQLRGLNDLVTKCFDIWRAKRA
jgi:hypothetical protein